MDDTNPNSLQYFHAWVLLFQAQGYWFGMRNVNPFYNIH